MAGIVMILLLVVWHLRTRRHPHWQVSRDARFYITTAYPFLVVAVFFLANADDDTDLSWISGIGWAFIATVMFVYGFQALDSPEDGAPSTGEPETKPAPNTMPPRTAARRKSADSKR